MKNFTSVVKNANPFLKTFLSIVLSVLLFAQNGVGQTYYAMSGGNYTEGFTGWTGYATNWNGLAILGTGTIPAATKTTVATTSLANIGGATATSAAIGYDAASSTKLLFLSTGSSDNTSAVACDLNLNFTNRTAGTLSFDAATYFNQTGDRKGTLKVYYSIDGTNWTEITGTNLPYVATNNVTGSASISVSLPSAISGQSTVKLRFYYHNGSGGTAGSRPKISLDNVGVTSTAASSCTPPTTQPSSFSINTIAPTSTNFAFTRGNGDSVIVVARLNSTTAVAPTSGTIYTSNSVFGSGGTTGTNNFVVYKGTAAGASTATGNLSVTGLAAGSFYVLTAYEFSSTGTCYNTTSPATINFNTFSATPSGNPAIFSASATDQNNIGLSFSALSSLTNASGYLIFQRAASSELHLYQLTEQRTR